MKRTVLISGAGIGGLTIAYWLHRWGFVPTIIERAPELREGGYLIDFFGLGYDVAERMGLQQALARHDLLISRIAFVDAEGRPRGGFDAGLLRELMDNRLCNIPRGSLARVLFDRVKDDVEIHFGRSVDGVMQHANDVAVQIDGRQLTFDLVIGADGLHSNMRRLVFGSDQTFERFFGYYTASFTVEAPSLDATFASYTSPGKQVGVYPVGEGRLAAFFLFSCSAPLGIDRHDRAAQIAALRAAFRGIGWKADELLTQAHRTRDFYFDAVSQVQMPEWAKERVALVGDACCCPSLLSGQGASLAMAGAYVLAGELKESAGGHRSAYARYQQLMKPYVDERQALAARFASSFLPSTSFGIVARNVFARLMAFRRVSSWFVARFATDALTLRSYE